VLWNTEITQGFRFAECWLVVSTFPVSLFISLWYAYWRHVSLSLSLSHTHTHTHTRVSRQILLRRKLQLHFFSTQLVEPFTKNQMGKQNKKSGKGAVTKRASGNEYSSRTCYEIQCLEDWTLLSFYNSTKFRGRRLDDFKTGGHFDARCSSMRRLEIGTVSWLFARSCGV
jgi:hypothetical protein